MASVGTAAAGDEVVSHFQGLCHSSLRGNHKPLLVELKARFSYGSPVRGLRAIKNKNVLELSRTILELSTFKLNFFQNFLELFSSFLSRNLFYLFSVLTVFDFFRNFSGDFLAF
jgi:hypothetical protein